MPRVSAMRTSAPTPVPMPACAAVERPDQDGNVETVGDGIDVDVTAEVACVVPVEELTADVVVGNYSQKCQSAKNSQSENEDKKGITDIPSKCCKPCC